MGGRGGGREKRGGDCLVFSGWGRRGIVKRRGVGGGRGVGRRGGGAGG